MKKLKSLLLGCFLLLYESFFFSAEASPQKHPAFIPPRIRAAYWGIKPVDQATYQLHLLKKYGLNTALVKDTGFHVNTPLWNQWATIARQNDIHFFPVLNFAGKLEREYLQGKYIPYINRDGTIFQCTPCPLDENYWDAGLTQRFLQLAQLSLETPLAGILFDTELYGGELSTYENVCFCDTCWNQFRQANNTVPALPNQKRFNYLVKQGLFEQYITFQERRLQTILVNLEQQTHDINPHLLLGFLAYCDTWFYRGLLQGLGTATAPVVVFSESSYIQGYTLYVPQEQTLIKHIQPFALYIPGIWLGRFFPADLSSQGYALATHTDGYWFFTADSLWTAEKRPEPYALHGSPDEYWAALQKANEALQQSVDLSPPYTNQIPSLYQASFYDNSQQILHTQPSLRYLFESILPASHKFLDSVKIAKSGAITYRGKVLLHCFRNMKAEITPATINITHVSIDEKYLDETRYTFFDNEGGVFWEGSLNPQNRSKKVTLPPHVAGLVSLLLDSGRNAAQVSVQRVPYVIEASTTFPLSTVNTSHRYLVYIEPEQRQIKLRAYCAGSETALIALKPQNDLMTQELRIVSFTEADIDVPLISDSGSLAAGKPGNKEQQTQRFWMVDVKPVPREPFEDVKLYFYNQKYPYLLGDP